MSIDKYMTPSEAAYKWGINQETVKNKLKPSLNKDEIEDLTKRGLIKSFMRPDGKRREWIITTDAMEIWFGKKEEKKIKISVDINLIRLYNKDNNRG